MAERRTIVDFEDGDGGRDNQELLKSAMLQSNHHHQRTNTQVFYRPDTLSLAQTTVSKHVRSLSVSILTAIFPCEPVLVSFIGAKDNGSGG